MKKDIKQTDYELPLETMIEVVRIKKDIVQKEQMTFKEALELEKEKGWAYYNYQIGYCTIKENNNN